MSGLHPRDLEFMALRANGLRNKQIALEYGLKVQTVDLQMHKIREILGALTDTHAVTMLIAREELILQHDGTVAVPRALLAA